MVDVTVTQIIEVDASAGVVTVTYPPTLATGYGVTVAKTDTTTNAVNISPDGATVADAIVTPANGPRVDARTVWSNGTTLHSAQGGPSGADVIITTNTNHTIT